MNEDIRKNVGGGAFGAGLRVSVFACRGESSESICNEINTRVLNAIKMNTGGIFPSCWNFPTNEGKGGTGITLIQPLVESFLIWDTWVENKGAYLFVVSCKEYDAEVVENILREYFEISQINVFTTQI
jgi:hypothetical protein